MRPWFVPVLWIALTAGLAGQQEEESAYCTSSFGCHRKHPREKIQCPGCDRRKIPSNDAFCSVCGIREKVCKHCGRPRPGSGGAAAAPRGWVDLNCRIEQVGSDVYLSFQPLELTEIRLSRGASRALAWGVQGRVKAELQGGAVVIQERTGVAEVVLFDCEAKDLKVRVQAAEAMPKAEPPKKENLQPLGEFRPTCYYVLSEEGFDGERNTPLKTPGGETIGMFPADFVRKASIEGTAKLKDGRVVNIITRGTWKVVDAPNGLGVGGNHLIPFRSIAVDRGEIAIGTKVFLPDAVGMELPDGTVHDGIFYAHDIGGGIKGKRIDLFTGGKEGVAVFAKAGIRSMQPMQVFAVK